MGGFGVPRLSSRRSCFSLSRCVFQLRSQSDIAASAGGAKRSITGGRDLSAIYFAPLSGTALETRSIKTLFPEPSLLTGKQVTEAAIKQVEAPSIWHIATHGFSRRIQENPGPTRSDQR